MRHRQVSPDKIRVPEVRVTARFDEETWRQFQGSVAEIGTVAPIICCEVDGELVLVDGLHRLMEARRVGKTPIDVVVVPGDMVDVLTKNIFLDHLRGKTPPSEMVKVIETLSKEYGLDSEGIAQKTGMERDYVEKLIAIAELTPLCRAALDEERIKVGHAFALSRIKDPVRQEMVLGQLELYHWSIKALNEYIDQVEALVGEKQKIPMRETPPPPIKVKCFYCKGEFEPYEVASPITCQACSGIMISAVRQAEHEAAASAAAKSKGES